MAVFDVTQNALVASPAAAAAIASQLDAPAAQALSAKPFVDDGGAATGKTTIALRLRLPATSRRDAELAVEALLKLAADRAGALIEMTESVSLEASEGEHPA